MQIRPKLPTVEPAAEGRTSAVPTKPEADARRDGLHDCRGVAGGGRGDRMLAVPGAGEAVITAGAFDVVERIKRL